MMRWWVLFSFTLLVSSCGGVDESTPIDPPPGWQATETKWWQTGVDTSVAFRDLETLVAMDVVGSRPITGSMLDRRSLTQQQLTGAVKHSLIKLYRNDPVVVDSLFERYVSPEISHESPPEDVEAFIDRLRKRAYDLIDNHFRPPYIASRLGTDVPVIYPDSLQKAGIAGVVRLQVYLSEEGEPLAVELLEGVHPVLNRSALLATAQTEWRSAYLLRNGNWRPVPAWSRFNVTYRTRSN